MIVVQGVFDIKFSEKLFDKYFKKAVEKEINQALGLCVDPIQDRIRDEFRWAFINSPEYLSLNGGELAGEFGFIKGNEESRFLKPLLDWLVSKIDVYVSQPFSYDNGGELMIELAVFDREDLYSQPFAEYISSGKYNISWLEWLLEKGNKIIIYTHKIDYENKDRIQKFSRSKQAIMVKQGTWKVPSEFAGTVDRNWITETFRLIDNKILNIIKEEFCRNLS